MVQSSADVKQEAGSAPAITPDQYLRLQEAPRLMHPGNPSCGACTIVTDFDGDQWLCPGCGTAWPVENLESDGADAVMFPEWSGNEMTGPVCPNDQAWLFANTPAEERDERVRSHLEAASARKPLA